MTCNKKRKRFKFEALELSNDYMGHSIDGYVNIINDAHKKILLKMYRKVGKKKNKPEGTVPYGTSFTLEIGCLNQRTIST